MNLPEWVPDSRWLRLALQVVGALLVIIIVTAGAWAWYRSRESRAHIALGATSMLVQRAEEPEAPPTARTAAIQGLEAVLTDYPRGSTAPQAAYQLGNLKYAAGQYAEARASYEVAIAKGATGSVRALAAMGVGYTWEAQKEYAKAATAYDAVVTSLAPKDFLYEEAIMAEARSQELAGKADAALDLYLRALR